VPGLTDDAQDLKQMAQFIASLGVVERVEVLPFHQLGRFKWRALGLDYTLENTKSPSPDLIEMACGVFRAEGLKAF
jgi:pyruvate formate lyase activating enzyme